MTAISQIQGRSSTPGSALIIIIARSGEGRSLSRARLARAALTWASVDTGALASAKTAGLAVAMLTVGAQGSGCDAGCSTENSHRCSPPNGREPCAHLPRRAGLRHAVPHSLRREHLLVPAGGIATEEMREGSSRMTPEW